MVSSGISYSGKVQFLRNLQKLRYAGTDYMDILKKLFEQHFHSPAERVQPLQGELGGSGRKIIRL